MNPFSRTTNTAAPVPGVETVTISRTIHDTRTQRLHQLEQQLATAHTRILDLDQQLTAVIAERDALDQLAQRIHRDLTEALERTTR